MQNLESKHRTPTHLNDQQYRLESAVLDASAKLNLYEKRLILLAINEARGKEISSESRITLEASKYVETFGGDIQSAYEELKLACKNTFARQFTYHRFSSSGSSIFSRSRWVSQIGCNDEEKYVLLYFAPSIIPILKCLEEKFSNSNSEQISLLSNKYAIRLYDVLVQFQNLGKLTIGVEELRKIFELETDTYRFMSDFKKFALDLSVNQINDKTDLNVTYTQKKTGVQLSSFTFKVKSKPKN